MKNLPARMLDKLATISTYLFNFYVYRYYVLCTTVFATICVLTISFSVFTIMVKGVDDYYIIPTAMTFGTFSYGLFFVMVHKYRKGWRINVKISADLKKGAILDWLLPPGEVDHRIIELEEGRDRWEAKYGPKRAEWLYIWQSIVTVALFWFDRVVVKLLVRRS